MKPKKVNHISETDKQIKAYLANMSREDAAKNAHLLDAVETVKRVAASSPFRRDDTAVRETMSIDRAVKQSDLESRMTAILDKLTLELYLTPFEAEYRFHPVRRFRSDFANVKLKILIECEGGGWLKTSAGNNKGHSHPKRFESDCEKYNIATSLGWHVYRFTGAMIRDGRAESFLRSVIPPF